MNSIKKIKQLIKNEIDILLKENNANDIINQDFKNNFMKVKKLGQHYDNIVDSSFTSTRIKELKIDLFNMFVDSLDSQTKTKYVGISEINALKIADALIAYYRKNKSGVRF